MLAPRLLDQAASCAWSRIGGFLQSPRHVRSPATHAVRPHVNGGGPNKCVAVARVSRTGSLFAAPRRLARCRPTTPLKLTRPAAWPTSRRSVILGAKLSGPAAQLSGERWAATRAATQSHSARARSSATRSCSVLRVVSNRRVPAESPACPLAGHSRRAASRERRLA